MLWTLPPSDSTALVISRSQELQVIPAMFIDLLVSILSDLVSVLHYSLLHCRLVKAFAIHIYSSGFVIRLDGLDSGYFANVHLQYLLAAWAVHAAYLECFFHSNHL